MDIVYSYLHVCCVYMINSWNTKVKEFLKKTRITLRKVRKDTHITPYSINNTKCIHIYMYVVYPGPGKLIQTKENPC